MRRRGWSVSEIAFDVARGGKIFRILPQRIGLAVLPEILRLERHDLFEMRAVRSRLRNIGRRRPTGSISAIAASSVCRARLIAMASPASARVIARSMLSASMYFWFSPQPPSFLVGFVDILRQRRALLLVEERRGRRLYLKASPTEGPGEGSSMMALSSACIRSGSI